ncbi:MAG: YtxH domain-containing protein [Bacteroidota bacterium]
MNSGKVILGVLAGVAAGVILGILFAPDKGSETRKKIVKKGEDSLDDLKEKLNEIMDQFEALQEDEPIDIFESEKS